MQVAFNAPHFPFAVPDEYSEKYGQLGKSSAIRAGMIEALDVAIGNILVVLDQENLRQNTLVLFLSDNGADQSGRNAPFRNAKGSVYEGGIHVPCIMRWPNELKADSVSPQVMSAQDWYPNKTWMAGIFGRHYDRVDESIVVHC
jgi:arylsulfatase A-like enzyme